MNSANMHSRLIRACYSVMLPIARLLLRSGVGFKEFSEVSRLAFVEVATTDYGLRGRPTNLSRVAAMTGIPRKQVKRLRATGTGLRDGIQVELGLLNDVMERWYTDEDYLDSKQRPKLLGMKGTCASFEKLVKACAADVPAGAVKVELIRFGSAEERPGGRLRALRRGLLPEGLDEKVVTALAFSLRALASTIAFNTSVSRLGARGRIERFCVSDTMADESIRAMHPILRERVQAFADEMTGLLAQPKHPVRGRRVGVGVFYYEDD